MCLAWAGLAIGEYGAVVALNDFIYKIGSNRFVDWFLRWIDWENIIKAEYFIFSWISIYVLDQKLFLFIVKI